MNCWSPQHLNGRMSQSPISRPRATSGASTPLTGGTDVVTAVPFSHSKHGMRDHDGFNCLTNCTSNIYPSGTIYHEPKLNLLAGMQQGSPKMWERRLTSEVDILTTQFGRLRHDNLGDPHENQPIVADSTPVGVLRDQMKLKPNLASCPSIPNRANAT